MLDKQIVTHHDRSRKALRGRCGKAPRDRCGGTPRVEWRHPEAGVTVPEGGVAAPRDRSVAAPRGRCGGARGRCDGARAPPFCNLNKNTYICRWMPELTPVPVCFV